MAASSDWTATASYILWRLADAFGTDRHVRKKSKTVAASPLPQPCLPKHCAPRKIAVNLGLPRTGTTWLHALLVQLGYESMHCNVPLSCRHSNGELVNRLRLRLDMRAALQPANATSRSTIQLALGRYVASMQHRTAGGFMAFGDLPWYYAPRRVLEAIAPDAVLLVTNRSLASWVESVEPIITAALQASSCERERHSVENAEFFEYARTLFANDVASSALLCKAAADYHHHHNGTHDTESAAVHRIIATRVYARHAVRVARDFPRALAVNLPPSAMNREAHTLENIRSVAGALGLPLQKCHAPRIVQRWTSPLNAGTCSNSSSVPSQTGAVGRRPCTGIERQHLFDTPRPCFEGQRVVAKSAAPT